MFFKNLMIIVQIIMPELISRPRFRGEVINTWASTCLTRGRRCVKVFPETVALIFRRVVYMDTCANFEDVASAA